MFDRTIHMGVANIVIETVLIVSIVCNILLAAGFIWKSKEASRDHLTQLKNYKAFLREFYKYARNAAKKEIPFAVLFVDIDHFKNINDQYSHLSGDEAIKAVGQRLRSEIKSTDLIARYGGEEFIVCLKHCTLSEAENVANRMLRVVSDNPVNLEKNSIQLTVSIGVAGYPDMPLERLLRTADKNMYEAKRRGRNRVHAGNVYV